MSRGGRGGGRGGRGGPNARGRIGGLDTPWEFDAELEKAANVKKDYSSKFPDINLPITRPASRVEKDAVARYRSLRERMHEGPLYTTLGDGPQSGKQPPSGVLDPFEGMRTYSQRFQRAKRGLPRLDSRPFVMEFFPEELRKTLDPNYDASKFKSGDTTDDGKNKSLQIMKAGGQLRLEGATDREDPDDDVDMDKAADDDDPEDQAEEEQDDDFEDDESEGDDYNAEQYFDNDEDDYGDDGDDDGGGDGDMI